VKSCSFISNMKPKNAAPRRVRTRPVAAEHDLGSKRASVRTPHDRPRPLDELSQDLRFAFRTLFKHRAVAVFAIISLALGIGANTAIYSFMDASCCDRCRSETRARSWS
jgi:hypothetical protein